jgi:hypothetical protein
VQPNRRGETQKRDLVKFSILETVLGFEFAEPNPKPKQFPDLEKFLKKVFEKFSEKRFAENFEIFGLREILEKS